MILFGKIRTIWIALYKIDFRKGHWSLLSEAYNLGLDPLQGDVVLFVSRDKRKLKLLYNDPTGLWLAQKCFHKSTMKSLLHMGQERSKSSITAAELAMLIEGALFTVHKRVEELIVKD
ncbi:MAG: IS66 family insertion sequence element accessory protein TnpB [Oligoflexus sp.]|nr:IS66 family insertion sequence element accessory protein TnpB [Oligoflexus sp.]